MSTTVAESPAHVRSGSLRLLAPALLGLACLLPGLLSTLARVVDPFFYRNAAFLAAELSSPVLHDRDIAGTSYRLMDHIGYDSLLGAVARVTGIDPGQLMFLAVGAAMVPLLYYALARTLLRSRALAAMLALYAAYDPTMGLTQYSTHNYAWMHVLFLAAALVYGEILVRGRTVRRVLWLFALFLTSFVVNWTVPVWLILLVGLGALLVWCRDRAAREGMLSLAAAFLVLYFGYSQVFYRDILGALERATALEAVPSLLQEVGTILGWGHAVAGPENFQVPPTGSAVWDWARLLRTLVLALGTALPAACLLWEAWRRRRWSDLLAGEALWAWAMLGAGIGAALAYTAYGHVSVRLLVFMLPVVGMVLWQAAGLPRRYALGFGALLVALAVAQFAAAIGSLWPTAASRDEGLLARGAEYVQRTGDGRVLSDLGTLGIYLLEDGRRGESFLPCYYSAPRYAAIIGYSGPTEQGEGLQGCDVLVINLAAADRPTASIGWRYYEPLAPYMSRIDANPRLQRVYDDGVTVVYRISRGAR